MDNIEAVIEKIKKAIRLANKTTEAGERETAMRLAKNLAEKNGIAIDEVMQDTRDTGKQEQVDTKWVHGNGVIDGHTCVILRQHFGVVVMMTAKGVYRRFTYFGNSLNIGIAKYVFDILQRESARAWRQVRKEEANYGFKVDKQAFMRGWFFRIHKKLEEHPLRNDIDADAAAAEKAFKKYAEAHETTQKKIGRGGKNDDDASLYRGYMMAKDVSLNRPCECGAGEGVKQVGRQAMIGHRA